MILVDTSIWIDHLRRTDPELVRLLHEDLVLTHPAVIGELACGSLKHRSELLSLLAALPVASQASVAEVLVLIERRRIFGRGIGWVDAQLLASSLLSSARLWTRDKRLREVARHLDLALV